MTILIDMNLSPLWVPFLVEHEIEAVHWSTVGEASAPDSQILGYAGSNGFTLFTHDLDFGMLLAVRRSPGPSVIQVRTQDVLPAAIGTLVLRAMRLATANSKQALSLLWTSHRTEFDYYP